MLRIEHAELVGYHAGIQRKRIDSLQVVAYEA
jgi:hypothetical protein